MRIERYTKGHCETIFNGTLDQCREYLADVIRWNYKPYYSKIETANNFLGETIINVYKDSKGMKIYKSFRITEET